LQVVRGGKVKVTVGGLIASALALVATGFLFAAGYDIYRRLFNKP